MLNFNRLWTAHPTIGGPSNPCSSAGTANFPNQCAICLGTALARCGIETKKIPGARHCWQHDRSAGHILRAEELAVGLTRRVLPGLGQREKIGPEDYERAIRGRTGIIFFKDYWRRTVGGRREAQRNRSGDHIDLWNGSRMTDWKSWFRIRLGLTIPGVWSDLEASRQIWFWRLM